ncbi:ATP-binding protein [Reichenbachiella ulvae]|uniref:histidine kinase n=1 Tax=Reichenbachiella ulvae TaxID=2980104 RepID=A0ABT3CQC7_9BACT|nr:ATP-binding protein [Reichenbachiella ulvae]MCV9385468.1 ATP-binding protein [Reichenbachiella ulvae]
MIKCANIVGVLILLFCSFTSLATDISWSQFQEAKKGSITVYFRSTEPFMIVNENGTLKGLEYEMMMGFKYYLLNHYGLNLDINWQRKNSFREIYNHIKNDSKIGDFGLDIISKIPEREAEVQFSAPYFPDIQVLITHRDAPFISYRGEFSDLFMGYHAISVKQTTYDKYLHELKVDHDMDFDIEYISSSNDIIKNIEKNKKAFGYVDLPNYILALNNNLNIKRLNLMSKKGFGYCLVFNPESDWTIPFNEYLQSEEFKLLKTNGIQKYLGYDVNELIQHIAEGENEEIVLLQKEKQFMNEELYQIEKKSKEQTYIQNILLASIILALIFAYFLYNSNRVKSKANEILTKHRQMIEQQNALLSRRNEELVARDEEKNNFIHILSHDLRAPINNITGLAKILGMAGEDELNEEQLRMINHIATESRRLNKMVTRILDIEKIESKTSEQFERLDLKEILQHVIENYNTQASAKNITVESNLQEAVEVMGDEQYLFHVFENLLSNGIKFSPHGTRVFIDLKTEGHLAVVEIKDEGPGMTDEDQRNMFKKFQVLSAKATAGERSTGLGLSIVNKYIGLLGGELECDSEPGMGTTFIVKLSLA